MLSDPEACLSSEWVCSLSGYAGANPMRFYDCDGLRPNSLPDYCPIDVPDRGGAAVAPTIMVRL